jgi:hypothetical protein
LNERQIINCDNILIIFLATWKYHSEEDTVVCCWNGSNRRRFRGLDLGGPDLNSVECLHHSGFRTLDFNSPQKLFVS